MRITNGYDVLLVDTDKQGSASSWSDIRDMQDNFVRIPNIQKFGSNLTSDIKDLHKRYQDIIIDAGGRDSVELRAAMTIADVMYIPVQASQFDIWTLSVMNDLARQASGFNSNLKPKILINRGSTNPSISEVTEAQEVMNDFDLLTLSNCVLRERIAYRKAAKDGLSIIELEKTDLKAWEELQKLYNEAFNE
jgi:chromosome partitioning protein